MKNYYKVVESMLYNYKKTQCEIKNIELDIEEIKNEYQGINPISYEEKTSSSNQVSSCVESEVINKERRIEYLNRLKVKKRIEINKIDNALETLDDREKNIITLRYFSKISNKKVANILDLTEQRVSELKTEIINELINLIILKKF